MGDMVSFSRSFVRGNIIAAIDKYNKHKRDKFISPMTCSGGLDGNLDNRSIRSKIGFHGYRSWADVQHPKLLELQNERRMRPEQDH